jgi:hypothetical protein
MISEQREVGSSCMEQYSDIENPALVNYQHAILAGLFVVFLLPSPIADLTALPVILLCSISSIILSLLEMTQSVFRSSATTSGMLEAEEGIIIGI